MEIQPPFNSCLSWQLLPRAVALLSVAMCGCYDGQRLIDQALAESVRSRFVEVDLGEYRISLPRDDATATVTELHIHVFGNVLRNHAEDVEQQLAQDAYQIRNATILMLRQATAEELADPDLTTIRKRLADAFNQILADAPIDSVGFAELKIIYR